MKIKKTGYPVEGELVICSVTKVHSHSVFVVLDEYDKSGMVHISEISPGRIRNIRDYVVEGKVIICKVLRIDREKGHIDLSLRRVSESQKRQKADSIKQQQIAEKIVEFVAKEVKVDSGKLVNDINEKISGKYDSLYGYFEDVVSDDAKTEDLGIDAKTAKLLEEIIKQRIKEQEVEIKATFSLKSYEADGVEIVKEAMKKAEAKANEKTMVRYKGGGTFIVTIKASEYKEAENTMDKMRKAAEKLMDSKDSEFKFERIES